MLKKFVDILSADGKKNSIQGVDEVVSEVLKHSSRLEELYATISHEDAWVRMRAIDAFEKICRQHPEWLEPYIDRIQKELSRSEQPSIQWHIAEIYREVVLNEAQKQQAIRWLCNLLQNTHVDWIVAADAMKSLAYFTENGDYEMSDFKNLLAIQLGHPSKAVAKKAQKLLMEFS